MPPHCTSCLTCSVVPVTASCGVPLAGLGDTDANADAGCPATTSATEPTTSPASPPRRRKRTTPPISSCPPPGRGTRRHLRLPLATWQPARGAQHRVLRQIGLPASASAHRPGCGRTREGCVVQLLVNVDENRVV